MPSFDVVSEVNQHELTNAVDQTNREVGTRFDFKGTNCRVEQKALELTLIGPEPFHLEQMLDILRTKLVKRGIDIASLDIKEPVVSGAEARRQILVRQGIDKDLGREIVKLAKGSKLKIQAAIQQEQVRVTAKSRDDLQAFIAAMRKADLGLPLQFTNFRD